LPFRGAQKKRQLLPVCLGFDVQRHLLILAFCCLMVVCEPSAHADIYKCTDEDGNVAYLQLPCPATKAAATEVARDADSDTDIAAPQPPTPSSRLENESLENCKKRYRDQIDEIDAEMRADYSPEQSDSYMERLRPLTQQLRACR
jgi:hypothetical protein